MAGLVRKESFWHRLSTSMVGRSGTDVEGRCVAVARRASRLFCKVITCKAVSTKSGRSWTESSSSSDGEEKVLAY